MPGLAVLRRWRVKAEVLKQEYDQVQGDAVLDTLRRFGVVVWVAVPLHSALALWFFLYQAPVGRAAMQSWADALAWLQTALVLALLVSAVLARRMVRRRHAPGPAGLVLQAAFCSAYLAFGAAAAILDVGVGNGIATFLIISMGVAVLSLMRPLFSALVFGLAFGVFGGILHTASMDATLLASFQIQALSTVLMAQLISVMMWHQYSRRVLLSRKLGLTHAALLAKQQELETLAERDTLTGLYNRRKFMQLAEQELSRAARMPSDICLLMVDLDFFKHINDHHGHPAGDAVLQQVAGILLHAVRGTDVVARMGGEEFIVLMPNTARAGALVAAEKLRHALSEHPLDLGECRVPVTASIGVTGLGPQQRASIDALYAAADLALYAAKKNGRDRVESADPAVVEALAEFSALRA
ncbi:MAG: GGDEF domain-containing protein [Burkholderiales bacterium]|nr:GGDEF domain-containing protein [Burkholderiales bacterium]